MIDAVSRFVQIAVFVSYVAASLMCVVIPILAALWRIHVSGIQWALLGLILFATSRRLSQLRGTLRK
jgi:hypothetical protein